MFRMLKLKPPNGWNAVGWELAIVTVGVLMALGLQQWAEGFAANSRTNAARQAIRLELQANYLNAVEWRLFSPCVNGQLDQIERKVAASRDVIQPIPSHKQDGIIRTTIMAPRRIFDDRAWTGATDAGIAFQLTDSERRILSNAYWLADSMASSLRQFDEADIRLLSATRPIQLSPEVRQSLFHAIDELHAANKRMDRSAAEIIFWTREFGAEPSRADVERDIQENSLGVVEFCDSQRLPMRVVARAIDFSGN
jgi:hypothetical protein